MTLLNFLTAVRSKSQVIRKSAANTPHGAFMGDNSTKFECVHRQLCDNLKEFQNVATRKIVAIE